MHHLSKETLKTHKDVFELIDIISPQTHILISGPEETGKRELLSAIKQQLKQTHTITTYDSETATLNTTLPDASPIKNITDFLQQPPQVLILNGDKRDRLPLFINATRPSLFNALKSNVFTIMTSQSIDQTYAQLAHHIQQANPEYSDSKVQRLLSEHVDLIIQMENNETMTLYVLNFY